MHTSSDAPRVSVVIVNYNGKRWLDDCLKSLQNQTYKNFEIVLVDNGSRDSSVEFVREKFPNARVLVLEKNYGFAGGNLEGIKSSNATDFIVLLNNDTVADTNWLEELVCAADRYSDYDVLGSIQFIPSKGELVYLDLDVWGQTRFYRLNESANDIVTSVFVNGAALLFRRELISRIGYIFDDSYFAFAEDEDLGLRTCLTGGKVGYVTTSKLIHYGGSTWSEIKATPLVARLINRNKVITHFKCFGFKNFLKLLLCQTSYMAIRLIGRAENPITKFYSVLGLIEGVILVPRYVKAREDFHKRKSVSDDYVLNRLKLMEDRKLARLNTLMFRFISEPSYKPSNE